MAGPPTDPSVRSSANLAPHIIADLFANPVHPFAPAVVIEDIKVGAPISRRDAAGQKFVCHPIAARCADGTKLRSERRYSEFVALHEQIYVALGLPITFPVPSGSMSLLFWRFSKIPREQQLQQYLTRVLEAMRHRSLPTLVAFCRMPPYVAASTSAEASCESIPTATVPQCLAMLRAHPHDELVVHAGVQRLLALAGSADEQVMRSCLDAGTIEWLCAHLRQSVAAASKPSATLATSLDEELSLGARLGVASTKADSKATPSGRLDTLRTALGGKAKVLADIIGSIQADFGSSKLSTKLSSKLSASGKYASSSGKYARSTSDETAASIVGTLALLDDHALLIASNARQLMRWCGVSELLTSLMAAHCMDHELQGSCCALIAALVAADRSMAPEQSSHYEFEAAALVCVAMGTHRYKVEVQRHGTAALHALACKATPLAEEVVRHDGVRLICKAMMTHRSDSAARLQASACGALASLVDRVESVLPLLLEFSIPSLIQQDLQDFPTQDQCGEGEAIFVCGARALLTIADVAPPATFLLTSMKIEELALCAADTAARQTPHTSRTEFVLTTCCEVFAATARERLRMLAERALDLNALLQAGTISRAVHVITDALFKYPDTLPLVCAAMDATAPLLQLHHVIRGASAAGGAEGGGAISKAEVQALDPLVQAAYQRAQSAAEEEPGLLTFRQLASKALTEVERCRSGAPLALN